MELSGGEEVSFKGFSLSNSVRFTVRYSRGKKVVVDPVRKGKEVSFLSPDVLGTNVFYLYDRRHD